LLTENVKNRIKQLKKRKKTTKICH
jgi:hypothetical protein